MFSQDVMDRFYAKVEVDHASGCWIWTGASQGRQPHKKYGRFQADGVQYVASRFSWIAHIGPLDPVMFACHWCDNPICVNPSHLFPGTNQDNLSDAVRKGLTKRPLTTHCLRGHKRTPENTYTYMQQNGRTIRMCRFCHAERARNARKAKALRVGGQVGSGSELRLSRDPAGEAQSNQGGVAA
jgi:hypothetical protein